MSNRSRKRLVAPDPSFGGRLKKARQAKGMTQSFAASCLDMSPNTLYRIENGSITPDYNDLRDFGVLYDVNAGALMFSPEPSDLEAARKLLNDND